MTRKQDARPAWMTPLIYGGMILTIGSLVAGQFADLRSAQLLWLGLAILGLVLSLAPVLIRSPELRRELLRRSDRDIDHDWHS